MLIPPNKALELVIERVKDEEDVEEVLREIFNAGRDYERERIIHDLAGTKDNRKRHGALSRYADGDVRKR